MALENTSDNYDILWVAPLMIKQNILRNIDEQIERARRGEKCGLFFKTNSITDKEVIDKLVEASQAGVPIDLFAARHLLHPAGVEGYTDRVREVSIVGQLLEHSRLRLRPARRLQAVPVQRRSHDAQHGQAHRNRLAYPERYAAQPGAGVFGHSSPTPPCCASFCPTVFLHGAWRLR